MTMLDRDGVGIHYDVTESGDGTPVVMTHGYSDTGRVYDTTVAGLSANRRCLAWDLPGHGSSDSPSDPLAYSPGAVIGDLVALLDAEGIDRAVLVGHSLGGYLSIDLHRLRPERVAGLVLVGTGPGYRNDEARAGWNEMCEGFARRYEERGLGEPGPAGHVHRGVGGLVLAARHLLTQHDARVIEHLPAVDVPTLVVVGDGDQPFLASSSYLASKIPDARLVTIAGCGHTPMLTHPGELLDALGPFLTGVDAGVDAGDERRGRGG